MQENHGTTRVMTKRLFKALLLVAIALGLPGAAPEANTVSAGLKTLWDAPRGPGRSDDASRWLTGLRDSVSRPRPGCPDLVLPELSLTKPARAFQIQLAREQFGAGSPIVYLQEPIAEFFVVVATDVNGCPWLSMSGRGMPFAHRDIVSPFPYARLPALPEGAAITAIIQDHKAIRPWIMLADEASFARNNTLLWASLGTYSGILLMMIFVALGFDAFAGSRVALAYAFYCVALQGWLVQNFSIGSAFVPFWPGPQYFPILQAISVAGVVLGIGYAVLEFLQLRGRMRAAIGGCVLLSALCFLASAWHAGGYRAGAAVLFVLALATMVLLVRRAFAGDASIRMFTLGLGATMVGGGVQAFSVIGSGVEVSRLAAFAFPVGSLFQAAFWLAALIIRLREEHRELHELEGRQAAIMWATPDLILLIDRQGICLDYKQPEARRFFVTGGELLGKNVSAVLPTEAASAILLGIKDALQLGELQSVFIELPVESNVHHYEARIAPHGPDKVVTVVRDITLQKHSEEKIRRLAYFDTLTGLPNRQSFLERLDRELLRARRTNRRMALLFLDLDGFKRINDTLGHTAGDYLLQTIADRLREKLRAGAFIARPALDESSLHFARLGGDEFTVVLPDVDTPETACVVARRIQALLAQPALIGEQEIAVTSSIGIALFPDDGDDAVTLLKHADTAMYYAKEQGRNNWQLYTRTLTTRTTERLALEGDIRKGLERGEFRLFYQPQVSADDGTVVGMEALIRWQHPQRGLVLPGQFIPVAEESGLVVPIGEWVLNAACNQVREWQQRGVSVPRMAVNVSAHQLGAPQFLNSVEAIIIATGIAADRLELELTESVLMNPEAKRIKGLFRLRAMGVHFSIDDFGTGYSSLSYIRRFPIGTLKIDQSFVHDLPQDADDARITTAIISMARSLDLDVIAEGVETRAQLEFLQHAQCPKLQGYLFSHPLPPDEMEALLRRGRIVLPPKGAAE
ncbi:putative bifunctional diguanylate cyclase/phosphodiesterase [Accumulibacter sp.]|uniref:putative bifunctional diguanylate cyclase/phosphodiesterase n=1 Tax=Accumulibacter sp. TaxID=2053492 RepID=UPI0028C45ACF|nr:EAL domain-containing protein [Accumulibacter sp.]